MRIDKNCLKSRHSPRYQLAGKPIPQDWVQERWSGTDPEGWVLCHEHNTRFYGQDEPCWGCYREAQERIQ